MLPYIADAINHALYYNDHMASVHFENGRLHVHKEAIDAAKETSDASKTTTVKKETNWEHTTSLVYQYNLFQIKQNTFQDFRLPVTLVAYTGQHFTPPRSCV